MMATQQETEEAQPLTAPRQSSPSQTTNTAVRPNPTVVTGDSVIRANDTEKKKESERQAWFQNVANEELNIPTGYLKVAVLIVRWHEEVDAFREGHDKEIEELQTLFRGRFNYECEVVKLQTSKKPQNALNFAISQHILNHDGPNNLLIVYYTGHGRLRGPEDGDQRLELSATGTPNKRKRNHYAATAFWGEAEAPLLNSAESDVLAILDCCFASHAQKGFAEDRRTFELIAASPMNEVAYAPGVKSFTTALIRSLEELLTEYNDRNFPTTKLLDKINMNRNPPSMLWDRLHRHERHVQLAPLKKEPRQEKDKSFRHIKPEQAWVKLRFSLKEPRLEQDQIEELARRLPAAFAAAKIDLRRMDWIKMESASSAQSNSPTIAGTATVLSALGKLRRRRSQNAGEATASPHQGELTPTKRSRKHNTSPKSSKKPVARLPPTPSPASGSIGESSSD